MIRAAKIIGANVGYAEYAKQTAQRGQHGYVMSRGELCEFLRCPARWRAGFREGKSEEMDWGSLIDCLALAPTEFSSRYVVAPETYPDSKTGEAKEWNWNAKFCKDWRANQPAGVQVVKSSKIQEATEALDRLLSDRKIEALIECSQKQVYVLAEYQDRATGVCVPVRVLLDLVPDKSHPDFGCCLADLKTCATADPAAWPRAVFQHDYHTQAALYLDCYQGATDEDRTDWLHVIQESFSPWEPGRRLLSSEFLNLGREKYLHGLRLYAQCLHRNEWPTYDHFADYGGFSLTEPEDWMVMQSAWWPGFPMEMPTIRRVEANLLEVTP